MTGAPFDDFLGLAARDFSAHRVVAFVGESGSGKSTAIRFLLEQHRDFAGRRALVVDETVLRDFPRLWGALARGETLLLASHLPAPLVRAALPIPRVAVFRTDRDRGKIARHLASRGGRASQSAVDAYVRRFGATYTDVDLILERFPGRNFDQALAGFERLCALQRTPQAREAARYPAIRT